MSSTTFNASYIPVLRISYLYFFLLRLSISWLILLPWPWFYRLFLFIPFIGSCCITLISLFVCVFDLSNYQFLPFHICLLPMSYFTLHLEFFDFSCCLLRDCSFYLLRTFYSSYMFRSTLFFQSCLLFFPLISSGS